MRKVIGIGETVLDIIFRNEQPISAVPGGSTFNAIISLGRSGVSTSFISETGNDRVGRNIIQFLRDNGCEADAVNMYPDSKSPLSLAFLNEQNDAEYIFYKDHPHDRLDFNYPDVQPDDIVLFGSYYALNPVIRPQVKGFLDYAHQRGAILYYDVNFRASHQHEVMKLTPNLLENFELADIVRGSTEDFYNMFDINGNQVKENSLIDGGESLTEGSNYSDQLDKMKQLENGTRGFNARAASDSKLRMNQQICISHNLQKALSIVEAEMIARGLIKTRTILNPQPAPAQSNPSSDEIKIHLTLMDFHEADARFVKDAETS